jgi:hypothetical protein
MAGSGAREGRSPLVRSAVIRAGRPFAPECVGPTRRSDEQGSTPRYRRGGCARRL